MLLPLFDPPASAVSELVAVADVGVWSEIAGSVGVGTFVEVIVIVTVVGMPPTVLVSMVVTTFTELSGVVVGVGVGVGVGGGGGGGVGGVVSLLVVGVVGIGSVVDVVEVTSAEVVVVVDSIRGVVVVLVLVLGAGGGGGSVTTDDVLDKMSVTIDKRLVRSGCMCSTYGPVELLLILSSDRARRSLAARYQCPSNCLISNVCVLSKGHNTK